MKKKYKLIKEYPGSPKLGTTAEQDCLNKNKYYYALGEFATIFNPENFPEFWEEVKDKEYEILSFSNSINQVFTKKPNSLFSIDTDCTSFTEKDGLHYNYKIHSIKRLSDGEVFTVGDKISLKGREDNDTLYNIKIDKGIVVFNSLYNGIESWKKMRVPLFKTEDGVDYFEKDLRDFYAIDSNIFKIVKNTYFFGKNGSGYIKYFSTKEAAEEYILYNKPCLSLKDVASIYPGVNKKKGGLSSQANRLIELVKSKL